MPLENTCENHKGNLVFVLPIIGFGWCKIVPNSLSSQPGGAVEPPEPFHARITEFYYLEGDIKAGAGIVEEQSHPLDKEWVAFCIRDREEDMYNLTTKPGKYNVRIGKRKPTITIVPDSLPIGEWMQFKSSIVLSGLGYVAESATWIKDVYNRIEEDRTG